MHVFTKAVASHAQQLSGDKYNVDQAFRSMLTRCHVLCQLLDTSCLELLDDADVQQGAGSPAVCQRCC